MSLSLVSFSVGFSIDELQPGLNSINLPNSHCFYSVYPPSNTKTKYHQNTTFHDLYPAHSTVKAWKYRLSLTYPFRGSRMFAGVLTPLVLDNSLLLNQPFLAFNQACLGSIPLMNPAGGTLHFPQGFLLPPRWKILPRSDPMQAPSMFGRVAGSILQAAK